MSILHTQRLFSILVNNFLLLFAVVREILSNKKIGTSSPCISSEQINQTKIMELDHHKNSKQLCQVKYKWNFTLSILKSSQQEPLPLKSNCT